MSAQLSRFCFGDLLGWAAQGNARPPAVQPYVPKIRLLVTSQCHHKCPFCHNEGQSRRLQDAIDPKSLAKILPALRDYSRQITLSGGEPLQLPQIDEIVQLLADQDFDVTLVTAGAELAVHSDMLTRLWALHVSIVSLDPSDPLSSCNGPAASKLQDLRRIAAENPSLQIAINVPYVGQASLAEDFPRFLDLGGSLRAKIKFIAEFTLPTARLSRLGRTAHPWNMRWSPLLALLEHADFSPVASTPREVEFVNAEGVVVELSEIACVGVDSAYGSGVCFANMDLTVDPNLNVTLCRWQSNARPLRGESGLSLPATLRTLMEADGHACPYGIGDHPLASQGLAEQLFVPHGASSLPTRTTEDRLLSLVRRRELSIYGRSGVVATLERTFAAYHEQPYAFATSSGSAALFLAYRALGFTSGTEVIVPIYSYPGTVTPLLVLGAHVRFCDVDPTTGCIDLESLRKALTQRTAGVVLTHMWGDLADIPAIAALCRERRIRLVEDCSHAVGAKFHGRLAGTFSDAACFSFQQNKAISAGEGGMLLTADRDVYEAAVAYGSLRQRMRDDVRWTTYATFWETGLGVKLKIHPVGALLALEDVSRLSNVNQSKRKHAGRLDELLAGQSLLRAPLKRPTVERTYYTYKVLVADGMGEARDRIIDWLIRRGLRARRSDLRPLHLTSLFAHVTERSDTARFPGAESYCSRAITLPSFSMCEDALVDYYGRTLAETEGEMFGSNCLPRRMAQV